MSAFIDEIPARNHEQVSIFQNNELGIVAVIAVHNTEIGPGLGGCRMRPYPTVDLAVSDVLKLSQAMTWKNALAGIPFGGGKSVIITEPDLKTHREELFKWFGDCVDSLDGKYLTAEDMGSTVSDMEVVATRTKSVAGRSPDKGGAGDPSPFTALGVFSGIKACLAYRFGSEDLSERKVAVQGVGSVGMHLVKLLRDQGAEVFVADTVQESVDEAVKEYGATAVELEKILSTDCDVLAPCAIGGIINSKTINEIKAPIIAGGANNQLADGIESELVKRNFVYAPDFAINSGGVIMCADEFEPGGFNQKRVTERAENVHATITEILKMAEKSEKPTAVVAIELAEKRIAEASGKASA